MDKIVTYQQLTLLPSEELTDVQKTFLSVHTEMVMAGQKAAECLLIVANDLKRMRDEELYTAAGFEKFSDYVETALNIRERQARKWISILKLPEEYLSQNAAMGVTKLAAIASASETIATELMEDETTVNKSSRELTEIIRQKEEELAAKDKQVNELEEELETKNNVLDTVDADYGKKIATLKTELEKAKKDLDKAQNKLSAKESEIEKLSNKASEVITETIEKTVEVENPETQKALEEARSAAETARKEKEAFEEQAKQYQAELKAYKRAQETVATFKIHAGALFDTWDNVLEAVTIIRETDTKLAKKCLEKLAAFSETVKSDLEGVRQ